MVVGDGDTHRAGKVFTINYQLKDGKAVTLDYGRSELLSILHEKVEDYDGIKELPQVINNMIDGGQEPYVKAYFDGVFSGSGSISGMRLSVYCSDKIAFEDTAIIRQQEVVLPWLAGFHVNDVYGAVCDAWRVKAISAVTKKPYCSDVPALAGAGGLDDACRPLYNDLIHHYFPNSQRLLFAKRVHGPLLNSLEGDLYIGEFLDRLVSISRESRKSKRTNCRAFLGIRILESEWRLDRLVQCQLTHSG